VETGTGVLEIPVNLKADEQELFAMLTGSGAVVTEEMLGATFDELSAIAAEQPENEMVIQGIRQLVIEARDSGFVDAAMQMAMTLGAMACTHSHLEEVASEAGSLLGEKQSHSDHDAVGNHTSHDHEKHDTKTCKDCKKGSCKKR
jgi:hypothetical protein